MTHTNLFPVSATIILFAFSACTGAKKQSEHASPSFTKIDSVTEKYLNLQDSVLTAWNMMVYDDNCKLRSMQKLMGQLKESIETNNEELISLEQRLETATQIELKPDDINNQVLIEEYDFTINSLIQELVSLTESRSDFSENQKLQKIVEEIKQKDQQVDINRIHYDEVAEQFNHFLDQNKVWVLEIDSDSAVEKKPLFRVADSH